MGHVNGLACFTSGYFTPRPPGLVGGGGGVPKPVWIL
jgi:hypothetical protein